jgi:hypothetical protein
MGFMVFSVPTFAQVFKFKSTSFSSKIKNDNTGRWSDWSTLSETEVLITIDFDGERIKIFSKSEQEYDIIKFFEKEVDRDGDETLKFQCVNEDGRKCFVRFVVLLSKNGQRQLYVDFADMMWMYNIYKLD